MFVVLVTPKCNNFVTLEDEKGQFASTTTAGQIHSILKFSAEGRQKSFRGL